MKKVIYSILFLTQLSSLSAKNNLDSLWAEWNDTTQLVDTRLKAMNTLLWDEYLFSDPDSAFQLAQLQYDLAKKNDLDAYMARALNNQGISYRNRGEFSQALSFYRRSLSIYKKINHRKGIGRVLNDIGKACFNLGDFGQAMEYYNRSLKIVEEINDKKRTSVVLKNIGTVHLEQRNAELAMEYFTRSLEIYKETEYQQGMSGYFNLMGNLYLQQGDYHRAREFYLKSLKIRQDIGYAKGIGTSLDNIGLTYLAQNDYDQGMNYFNRSLKIRREMDDKKRISSSLNHIGKTFRLQNNNIQAIKINREALAIASEAGVPKGIRDAAKELYLSYKEVGDNTSALEMHELFIVFRDSIASEENAQMVLRKELQYGYEKQKTIDDLENEKLVAIETQKKTNHQIFSVLVGIALLLTMILAWVIFNRLKITRQQKAIIEEQKKKVEQSEKYKQEFLANMSHEIRTPMHAISGMVKILKRNEHPASQNDFLDAMHTSADNLVVILNDVLDISKIEAGKLDIENIPINPKVILENVTQILKYKAEEKGLKLTYKIKKGVPDLIMGDPTRLNQILINLVGNAIKFTKKGNVSILLKKENGRLKFSIKDTGIGIPKDKIETIFGAFEQAKDSISRHFGGTGLGLSISKQLVELQQGKIWVESEEGKGSTFFVELPFILAAPDALSHDIITEEKMKTMAAALEGIRILLVEDNPFNQMIAKDDLSFFIKNVKLDVVENGALAVEKFKSENYDLILMDVQMPEMNGFEATKKIRAIEKNEGRKTATPIIAMTASLLKPELDSCRLAGMNNYIPKPYKLEELIGTIFLENKRDGSIKRRN